MTTEHVIVQGAASAVGRRVIDALRVEPELAVMVVDGLGRAELQEALRRADLVINVTMGSAGAIREAAGRLYGMLSNPRRPRRVVHLSSMAVYGEAVGRCDEATAPTGRVSRYGAAHLAAESEARCFAPTVILRSGCEYGPDCETWSGRVAAWLCSRRIGDLGAGGDGCCNLIFIDDLARAVRAALRAPEAAVNRAFNIAMRAPPTWNEYLIAFAIALRATPVRRMTRRRWALETRLLAPPLKLCELALGRFPAVRARLAPPVPPSFRRLCEREIELDVTAAESMLGLEWTALEVGLRAAARAWERAVLRAARAADSRDALRPRAGTGISSREAE